MKKDNRNVYGNYELLDTILNKAVGKTLRRLRVERNLTQVELIKKMNNVITEPTLSKYESGYSKIRMNIFFEFAKAFDLEPKDLYAEINNAYMEDLENNMESFLEYTKHDIQNK